MGVARTRSEVLSRVLREDRYLELEALGALGDHQGIQREYRELLPRPSNDLWRQEHRKLPPTVLRVIIEIFRSMLSLSLAESPPEEVSQGERSTFNDDLIRTLHAFSIGKYCCCVNTISLQNSRVHLFSPPDLASRSSRRQPTADLPAPSSSR